MPVQKEGRGIRVRIRIRVPSNSPPPCSDA
jgi:hypothetical protein